MQSHLASWQILFDLGWFAVLLLILIYFWVIRKRMLAARSWFKTSGRITHWEWTKKGHTLWPKIEYVYFVGERELVGEFIFLDMLYQAPLGRHSRQVAFEVASAYQNDEEIEVFYNPAKPEEAVLDIEVPRKLNGLLIFIGALLVLHLLLFGFRLF